MATGFVNSHWLGTSPSAPCFTSSSSYSIIKRTISLFLSHYLLLRFVFCLFLSLSPSSFLLLFLCFVLVHSFFLLFHYFIIRAIILSLLFFSFHYLYVSLSLTNLKKKNHFFSIPYSLPPPFPFLKRSFISYHPPIPNHSHTLYLQSNPPHLWTFHHIFLKHFPSPSLSHLSLSLVFLSIFLCVYMSGFHFLFLHVSHFGILLSSSLFIHVYSYLHVIFLFTPSPLFFYSSLSFISLVFLSLRWQAVGFSEHSLKLESTTTPEVQKSKTTTITTAANNNSK